MAALGLVELGMSVSAKHVGDGGPDDAALRLAMAQIHSRLVSLGLLSEAEYGASIALLDDPAIVDTLFANVVAWGRRPD